MQDFYYKVKICFSRSRQNFEIQARQIPKFLSWMTFEAKEIFKTLPICTYTNTSSLSDTHFLFNCPIPKHDSKLLHIQTLTVPYHCLSHTLQKRYSISEVSCTPHLTTETPREPLSQFELVEQYINTQQMNLGCF